MRNFSLLLITLCAVSIRVHAVDEIIITAAPYTPPTPTYFAPSAPPSSTYFDYQSPKAAGLAQAHAACLAYALKQKEACDAKKDKVFDENIAACDKMGTNGTRVAVGGGSIGAIGAAIAIMGGPVGWAVLFIVGGSAVAGGGLLEQQEGNYGCRDDANANLKHNDKVCANYEAKIKAETCAKIY